MRAVFIAESPPAGGSFFYAANSKLYRATKRAFEQAIPTLRCEDDFLDAFMRLGCYLDDLCREPVNQWHLKDPRRQAAHDDGVKPLTRRLRGYELRGAVIVMLDIVPQASRALVDAGHGEVRRGELPFPGRHEARYVRELEQLVRAWRRARVFNPL